MPFTRSPALPDQYEDRFIDCQQEVDGPICCLVADMVAAGWTAQETLAAIVEVADNHMLAAAENENVNEMIKRLR